MAAEASLVHSRLLRWETELTAEVQSLSHKLEIGSFDRTSNIHTTVSRLGETSEKLSAVREAIASLQSSLSRAHGIIRSSTPGTQRPLPVIIAVSPNHTSGRTHQIARTPATLRSGGSPLDMIFQCGGPPSTWADDLDAKEIGVYYGRFGAPVGPAFDRAAVEASAVRELPRIASKVRERLSDAHDVHMLSLTTAARSPILANASSVHSRTIVGFGKEGDNVARKLVF